ncbi:hypothetical protein [Phaeocystidibacter luteus]|uniref:Uncharacterized protein n=1 Tax=Phaeocystidibacter luteus TaxID=911197 RepID=A0A6N6RGX5_9FLAO|nr:hypothetical protein [Phaeocystidibacter luteus]KAB2809993.1 hypothetical protein F8C67_08930 [Phaeocystidibacter luteus]
MDNSFLRRIKLVDSTTFDLPIQKSEFVHKLREQVEPGGTGMFAPFEAFSSSEKEFKGQVEYNGFEIRRRKRLFDAKLNFALVRGTYIQKGDKLEIKADIHGFRGIMIAFYVFLVIFYTIFITASSVAASENDGVGLVFFPIILIHGAFMGGIPYLFMRRSVKNMKRDLEKEFYFLIR